MTEPIKVDSKKRLILEYVQLFHPEITRIEFDNYIRQLNNFKRPLSSTIHIIYYCPWVFVRFIERRKNFNMGFFERMVSNFVEKLELKYYKL